MTEARAFAYRCEHCRKDFGGFRGFRDHRPHGVCLTADQLRRRGMHTNALGAWVRPDPTNSQRPLFPQPRRPDLARPPVKPESPEAGVDAKTVAQHEETL